MKFFKSFCALLTGSALIGGYLAFAAFSQPASVALAAPKFDYGFDSNDIFYYADEKPADLETPPLFEEIPSEPFGMNVLFDDEQYGDEHESLRISTVENATLEDFSTEIESISDGEHYQLMNLFHYTVDSAHAGQNATARDVILTLSFPENVKDGDEIKIVSMINYVDYAGEPHRVVAELPVKVESKSTVFENIKILPLAESLESEEIVTMENDQTYLLQTRTYHGTSGNIPAIVTRAEGQTVVFVALDEIGRGHDAAGEIYLTLATRSNYSTAVYMLIIACGLLVVLNVVIFIVRHKKKS